VSKFAADEDATNKENLDPNETNDWLHRNNSHCDHNIDDESISAHLSGD
jgi:hypothetical protein